MDWTAALQHLPMRLAVTDRKGRVLLMAGDIPNVRVGRSFLKLADKDEVMQVGRLAKRALQDGEVKKLPSVTTLEGGFVSIRLIPFKEGEQFDHLLVVVDDPKPPATFPNMATPAPAQRRLEEAEPITLQGGATPGTTEARSVRPLPPVPPPQELVVVCAGGTVPLARALAAVLTGHIKTSAWPVSRFVDALVARTGSAEPDGVERSLDPGTRVLHIGESPYAKAIQNQAVQTSGVGATGWSIGGSRIRAAAVWSGDGATQHPGDLVADLQFEMMEIVRKAMPIRRRGRIEEVSDGMKFAAAFLEQPPAMDMQGSLPDQARHHLLVMAIARFLQEGLEPLLGQR